MCKVIVDGTNAVARVVFDEVSTLGVLYPGYVIGEPITVQQGQTKTITIYNGGNNGPVSFLISFSEASKLVIGGALAATSLYLF